LRPALSLALVLASLLLLGCGDDGSRANESAAICKDLRALQSELNGPHSIDPDRLANELDNLSDRLKDGEGAGRNQRELANLAQITDGVDALAGAGGRLPTGSNTGLLLRLLLDSLSGLSGPQGYSCEHTNG
jgi:hypothetical protein